MNIPDSGESYRDLQDNIEDWQRSKKPSDFFFSFKESHVSPSDIFVELFPEKLKDIKRHVP
jgi:hypothetical protein